MDDIVLTDNGNKVMLYMQEHDNIFVGRDLGKILNIKGIYPVLSSLIKKGLVTQCTPEVRDFTNNKGKTFPKEYKTYSLTDKGRNFKIEYIIMAK